MTGVAVGYTLVARDRVAVLDDELHVERALPVVGLPTRARVSPDGRLVAWTVFATGDSYDGGVFSTRAGILDTAAGELVGTLESFVATVDGWPYRAVDENFWGVTFTPTFHATMSSAGHRWLVRGDLAAKTVVAVAAGVECPSLSPDGRGSRSSARSPATRRGAGAWPCSTSRPALLIPHAKPPAPLD